MISTVIPSLENETNTMTSLSHAQRALPDYAEKQQAALTLFSQQGWPTRSNEAWKYTPLTTLSSVDWQLPSLDGCQNPLIDHDIVPNAIPIVIVDGVLSRSRSNLSALPAGVTIKVIDVNQPATVIPLIDDWYQDVLAEGDPMLSMNAALASCVVIIEVAQKVVVNSPIQVIHALSDQPAVAVHAACLLSMAQDAQLTFVDSCALSTEQSQWLNTAVYAQLSDHASFTHYRLPSASSTATALNHVVIKQGAHSHYTNVSVPKGSGLTRDAVTASLCQSGAHARMVGCYAAKERQHADYHVQINHQASQTSSEQWVRSLVDDQALVAFTGQANVAENISGIDAQQTNHNLLLSPKAQMKIRPQLMVYSDDVQCSHGATVGQLDPKALFYCRSRGMSEREAKRLLTHAFVDAGFTDLPDSLVKEHARQRVYQTMGLTDQKGVSDDG